LSSNCTKKFCRCAASTSPASSKLVLFCLVLCIIFVDLTHLCLCFYGVCFVYLVAGMKEAENGVVELKMEPDVSIASYRQLLMYLYTGVLNDAK
jgi:hypothetical protein